MNNLHFACQDCKMFVDAGYRWAYWSLEHRKIVQRGQPVSVVRVRQAEAYWTVSGDADYLLPILARVDQFLTEHAQHRLIFAEDENFIDRDTNDFLDWLEDAEIPHD